MGGITIKENDMLIWDTPKTQLQSRLGDIVQYFQIEIPCPNNGIPIAYIDPTAIMPVIMDINTPDDIDDTVLSQARIPISMEEGYPTIDGIPFWERLEGEPVPYYKVFKEYRDMKYIDDKTGHGNRAIARLAESTMMSGKQLNALAKVYHWQSRVKAFDLFKSRELAAMKARNIDLLEEKHAKVSNQLLDQAVTYLVEHPEQLSPKVAIDLANLAMRSGRLALGLNPDKPGDSSSSGSSGRSINIINQNNSVGEGGQMTQVNSLDGLSEVERKTQENAQDISHLQSVLHILNKSGAFQQAADNVEVAEDEEDVPDNVIEADFRTT